MAFRLGIFGLSTALFLGHLFRYFPGLRQGVGIAIALLLIFAAVAGASGVMAMFMGRRYLTRVDVVMGMLPGAIAALAIVGVVVIGGLI